jgi:hypothetical protein
MKLSREGGSELMGGAVVEVSTLYAVENDAECFSKSDREKSLGSESETGLFSFPEVACAECLVLVECLDVDVVDEFRERVRVEEVDELERRDFNESGRVNQTSRGERGGDGRGDSDK